MCTHVHTLIFKISPAIKLPVKIPVLDSSKKKSLLNVLISLHFNGTDVLPKVDVLTALLVRTCKGH